MTKPSTRGKKARATRRKTTSKAAAERSSGILSKTLAPHRPSQPLSQRPQRYVPPFEEFRDSQVPQSMRALTESGVAQTRELYEDSKNAVQELLDSWHKSFGAAGQGAVAVQRQIFDFAERNISSSFDYARDLAGARNFAEAMELQTIYWRKQLGQWKAQAEEVSALSIK